ncbi:MAG: hypothetical protein KC729_12850 [Candidatus Eisenbacteria bacterium]|uniref:GCVT N-terminal domain-containing protein n=1 Tax=Eiseniibacteriota bacterium TaxID=2212470 RepID=A0A956LZP1_UNCEI|nr:hypothetical protein [Candidatus Eisenbacteria bacterium]
MLGSTVPLRFAPTETFDPGGAAWIEAPWERAITVTGKDAARFLHNLLTQDVLGMAVGSTRPAVLADRKGHLVAELWIWREEESRLRLRTAAPTIDAVLDVFARHRVMERVEWSVRPDPSFAVLVCGREAGFALGIDPGLGGGALADCGPDGLWFRVRELTPEDVVIVADADRADTVRAHLHAVVPIGWETFDRARIEAGRAWMGIDADGDRLVPEPGWDDRISYTKGCYLGQETLARLHYQGRLNWSLERISWMGETVDPGTDLRDPGGDRVGWVTSARASGDRVVALGYLHRRAREESLPVSLPDGRVVSRRTDSPPPADSLDS